MLLEFRVENYKSFKEDILFTMEAAADKKHLNNLTDTGKFRILKTSVIYGANASGKTKLIEAVGLMGAFVRNSHAHLSNTRLSYHPFAFDDISKSSPTCFQIKFLKNDVLYDYSFSYNSTEIVKESLYFYPKGKVAAIFERNGQEFNFVKEKGKQKLLSERVKKESLYLSVAHQFNYSPVKEAFEWLTNDLLVLLGTDSGRSLDVLIDKMIVDPKFRERVNRAFRIADLGIISVKDKGRISRRPEKDVYYPEPQLAFEIEDIWVDHTTVGRDGKNITAELPLCQESSGTIQFISTIGSVIDALELGSTLVVDDIDVNFHHELCKWILGLFHDTEENPKGAQLIFNTHDVELMDLDEIRRDQVWFTDKDWETGISSLRSLSEYKERNDRDIRRSYINGRYSAKPFISTERLMK